MSYALHIAARHGRILLILGLIGGFALPGVAAAMKPWLPALVALLVFLSALRIGARAALGNLSDAPTTLRTVLLLQLAAPLALAGALAALGWATSPYAIAAVLALSASSISGAPPFAAMLGHPPEPAMRLLILGTALLPLTVLPIFWLLPALGAPSAVALAALRLTAVLVVAISAGFALRRLAFPDPSGDTVRAMDGVSAITLAVIVVGLMAAVGPALQADPASLLPWLALCCATNFGMQTLARALGADPGTCVVAGNRNIALFLVALPPEVIEPLLLFVGCYQIPMYLTPLVMRPFYAR